MATCPDPWVSHPPKGVPRIFGKIIKGDDYEPKKPFVNFGGSRSRAILGIVSHLQQPARQPKHAHSPFERVILLVEDDPAILELFRIALQQAGYRVVTAASPQEALKWGNALGRIDLLASDIALPERLRRQKDQSEGPIGHGIALMRKLICLHPAMRVVLFSGLSEESLHSLGGIPEDISFLRKPFDGESLVRCIAGVFGKPLRPANSH
jgi:CheY-like chemotaxis protein